MRKHLRERGGFTLTEIMVVILILVGVYPSIMAPLVESGAQSVLALLGGA